MLLTAFLLVTEVVMTFHPSPPASQSIRITGQLFHERGPWGTRRPLRRSAGIGFKVREPGVGIQSGNVHPLGFDLVDGDGRFSIDASAMSIPGTATSIEEFIEIQYLPTEEIRTITLENVAWGFGSPTQEFGPFTFNWVPPERAVAEVNGRWFEDPQRLANNLAELLMDANPKPYSARTANIVLLWEPTDTDKFTRAQSFFSDLTIDREVHKDFPVRIREEFEKIPMLRTNMKTLSDAILNYLFKISSLQQHQFERGTLLETLVRAIGRSLGWLIDQAVFDPMTDAAAVCALLYTAGRMAKDKANITAINFGIRPVSWATLTGINTVEVTIGR
jgi:hypothetical protein